MALTGYLSKCALVTPVAQAVATATDIVVPVVGAIMPPELWAQCKPDGGDIRFTSDYAGSVEIPRQVIYIDTVLEVCLIRLLLPAMTLSTENTIYMHWNNSGAEEPAGSSASGFLNVYTNYYGAFNYSSIVSDWKGIVDSSGKWSNQTPNGTVVTGVGHIEGSTAIEISSTFGVDLHENITFKDSTNDLMFWCNLNGTSPVNDIANGTNGVPFGWLAGGQFGCGWGQTSTTSNAVPLTGWHHIWMRNVAGVCRCYVDGIDVTLNTSTAQAQEYDTWGKLLETSEWLCSDMRMTRNFNHAIDNVKLMVHAEINPNDFFVAGTVESVAVSSTFTVSNLIVGGIISIFDNEDSDPQFLGTLLATDTSVAGTTFTYTHDGSSNAIIVQFLADGYEEVWIDFTLSATDQTLPLTLKTEENL